MDNNSNAILTRLFNHINDVGVCDLRDCGIDAHNNLVFGRMVTRTQNNRLMTAISSHAALAELVQTHRLITWQDITPFLVPLTRGSDSIHARVASTAVPTVTHWVAPDEASVSTSAGGVKVTLNQQGVLGFAEEINRQQQGYSLVVSVGQGNSFNGGIAKAMADRAGDNYCRVSSINPLAPGQCFTYHCANNAQIGRSALSLCQNIHNVYVPLKGEQHYQQTMVNTFVNLFGQANGHHPLLACFVGCGQAGGNGKELARAIHAARLEFFNSEGVMAPGIILVGMDSTADRQVRDDFVSEWLALDKPSALSASKNSVPGVLPQKHLKGTSPAVTTGLGQVLLPGLLDIQMHPDNGMFGAARELTKKGERFALVNAANPQMVHAGGIARQFSRDLGSQFDHDTQAHPTQTGQCLTVGAYAYGTDPKLRLTGCENIHNVVAPQKNQHSYDTLFRDAFVNLLVNASKHGNAKVISCFFGCAIYGGNGTALANALHAAYQDSRVQSLTGIPHLSLVGWSGSSSDQKVHDDFIKQFKRQLSNFSLSTHRAATHEGVTAAISKMMERLRLDEAAKTVKPKAAEQSAEAAIGKDGMITCGICMESKSQTNAQEINELLVCSECNEDYQASGVNLAKFDALPEEFTAIRYEPLAIAKNYLPLPGHPEVGRIIVRIKASAPWQLSNGKNVSVTSREEVHYLPDNPVGLELLRLFEVLHKHQLIFKLDHSVTHGLFGITFNFHLKTSDWGGEPYHGYPDPGYPARALNEIAGLAHTYKLEKELDVSRLVELIEQEQS